MHLSPLCQQVIAYTVLDINRTTRMNEKPMTLEQERYLQDMAKSIQRNQRNSGDGSYLSPCHARTMVEACLLVMPLVRIRPANTIGIS